MNNESKYRLKPEAELAALLAGTDDICIIACQKCFQEFEIGIEPEADELMTRARSAGKNITGLIRADFLCGGARSLPRIRQELSSGTGSVFVLACGLGVQTVAGALALPVYAPCDTVPAKGYHGMALTEKTCGACAQCYLNVTGGVCPVADCAKGLLNGPCGGARSGRCETDPEKDCAWEKICRRLEGQGRLEALRTASVQLRDYAKADPKKIQDYVRSVREARSEGFSGGVHPSGAKILTTDLPRFPAPDILVIPLSMHTGRPADPLVKPGDRVKVGQMIGSQNGYIGAPVHAGVSGTVLAVEPRRHPVLGPGVLSVVIQNDGRYEPDDSVRPNRDIEELTPEEITDIIRSKGIVGMGGAGFPAYVKLLTEKPIDAVLLNGCECEPLLTADHAVLLHFADEVVYGLRAVMKAVGAPRGVIVIEDNKPDAMALLTEKTKHYANIEVKSVRTKYPQGAEKMLVKTVLGRSVPRGGLPADAGAVVSNVSTAKAIADAIRTGMPPVERVVCVAGEGVKNPGGYLVRIGTPVRALLDHCGVAGSNVTVKMGGPMMGTVQLDADVPVIKAANGIVVLEKDPAEPGSCIRCGRCADVCPMELFPLYFNGYLEAGDIAGLRVRNIMDCIECRCCEYICPAKIPLVTRIREGKTAVRGIG